MTTNQQQQGKRSILNIITDNLTTIFCGIIATCSIGILTFLWNLKETVPLIKQEQRMTNQKVDDIQNSVNGISKRFTILSEEQIRQGTKIDFLMKK